MFWHICGFSFAFFMLLFFVFLFAYLLKLFFFLFTQPLTGFPPWITFYLAPSHFPWTRTSFSVPAEKKNIPSSWCCHHHASLLEWSTRCWAVLRPRHAPSKLLKSSVIVAVTWWKSCHFVCSFDFPPHLITTHQENFPPPSHKNLLCDWSKLCGLSTITFFSLLFRVSCRHGKFAVVLLFTFSDNSSTELSEMFKTWHIL